MVEIIRETWYENIGLGLLSFVLAYPVMLFMYNIVLPVIDSLASSIDFIGNTVLQGVFNFGALAIILCFLIIAPSFFIVKGITLIQNSEIGIEGILIGIGLFIFEILFIVKTWYMVSTFSSFLELGLLQGLFYLGLLLAFIEIVIFLNGIFIIKGFNLKSSII